MHSLLDGPRGVDHGRASLVFAVYRISATLGDRALRGRSNIKIHGPVPSTSEKVVVEGLASIAVPAATITTSVAAQPVMKADRERVLSVWRIVMRSDR